MARVQDLPSLLARRFRTGRPCLDLVHTGGEGELAVWEILHRPADVARYLGVIAEVDGIDVAVGDMAAVREFRRAVTGAAFGAVAGRPPTADECAVINLAAARPPLVPVLDAGGGVGTAAPVTVSQVLSALARDAIDLFGSPLRSRIRVCAAVDCGMLFVDQSRPGTRRWCSMQRCGTRAKVRAHRQRTD
jgi:predicted RNA-binding Zn ribbon-like protein